MPMASVLAFTASGGRKSNLNDSGCCAFTRMDNDDERRAKSLQTLADNQRWLNEHPAQTLHQGDLPLVEKPTTTQEKNDQQ